MWIRVKLQATILYLKVTDREGLVPLIQTVHRTLVHSLFVLLNFEFQPQFLDAHVEDTVPNFLTLLAQHITAQQESR